MGENKKPAVTARQSARARAAEKMAERKQREKQISEKLESFFNADLLVGDAEKVRDDAIAKAQAAYDAATVRAHEEKAVHTRSLKDLGLTDRDIAELIDQPVGVVRDLLKVTKPTSTSSESSESNTGSDSAADDSISEAAATATDSGDHMVGSDTQIAS
jgi:hypothetical protein